MSTAQTVPVRRIRTARLDVWTVVVGISLLITCVFVQLLREWVGDESIAVRQSGLFPKADPGVRAAHHHVVTFTRATLVVATITALLWLAWQYQAHRALRAIRPQRPRFGPISGLVSWILPILPLFVYAELLVDSDPEERPGARRILGPLILVATW